MNAPALELLTKLQNGEQWALNELTHLLYDELHRIATRHLRAERAGHTLQATALVHEAYLKLFGHKGLEFASEVHFLAIASRVMRQVLVDYARVRGAKKRASGMVVSSSSLDSLQVKGDRSIRFLEVLQLDDALTALASEDESLARAVEMRYFGGMTAEETAEALGVSVHVIRHDLRLAQAWLRRRMNPTNEDAAASAAAGGESE